MVTGPEEEEKALGYIILIWYFNSFFQLLILIVSMVDE
jgi:hypothetical protein